MHPSICSTLQKIWILSILMGRFFSSPPPPPPPPPISGRPSPLSITLKMTWGQFGQDVCQSWLSTGITMDVLDVEMEFPVG